MPFQYGYILNVSNISLEAQSVNKASSVTMNIGITSISNATQSCFITFNIFDNNSVPVFESQVQELISGVANETYPIPGSVPQLVNGLSLSVPMWAFAGGATIHVDLFNANPLIASQHALPYCSEDTQYFTITLPP